MLALADFEKAALLYPCNCGDMGSNLEALLTVLDVEALCSRITRLIVDKAADVLDDGEDSDGSEEHGSNFLVPFENGLITLFLTMYFKKLGSVDGGLRRELLRAGAHPDLTRIQDELSKISDAMQTIGNDMEPKAREIISASMEAGSEAGGEDQAAFNASLAKEAVKRGILLAFVFYANQFFRRFQLERLQGAINDVLNPETKNTVLDTRYMNRVLTETKFPLAYGKILANNAVQRSYNYGWLVTEQAAGTRVFIFRAVIDKRTSQICRSLNGRKFYVADALRLIERATDPNNPTAAVEVTGWFRAEDVSDLTTQQLVAAGVMVPPLHPHCRSRLEASLDSVL